MRVSTSDRRRLLLEEAERIGKDGLREFVLDFLEDPRITFARVEAKLKLEEAPGAPKMHHSYPGGLIDHTLGVARTGRVLSGVFSDVYGLDLDADYVVAGALLHDIFKYYQYEYDDVTGGFRQREDWYLSHDFAIVSELGYRGADEYLIRVISEAHGFNVVATPEGQVLHLADLVDSKFASKLQDVIFRACIDVERETDGKLLAVKVFHSLMRNYTVFDLVPYIKRGSRELREFIRQELGIDE